jgi:hypothetical protein
VSGNDVRKRAIFSALMELGETFLRDDRPDILDRRRQFAELREWSQQSGDWTVSDEVMIEALWSATLLMAEGASAALKKAMEINDELGEAFDELDHITGARTRANIARREAIRERVIELRNAGEKVDYVARLLHITPRYVTELTPGDLKGRR